ncbi:transmembrane protein 176 [Echeneis naucrates]|uniref:High affinity immunoglobulin epsilon receptor subunit beta-like n=1 Tax=Echeneis naucrates TaxID=173247 RepID=A0A665URP0_ECHNA|nr:high affinity immunoglobulin epsilon receptor subunit beta-like [Echeneis naucrates]
MAVAVSRDLTVQVLQDTNVAKLTDRQQALRTVIQRGEPKCLGVSQVMLGIMVMTYSIPLYFTEVTEVIRLGVPWWSGIMFITVGAVTIILDKHCTVKILQVCLMASVVSAMLSVVAVIIYSVDISWHPETPCVKTLHGNCDNKHYTRKLSRGVKSSLLLFTLAQTVVSTILCYLLFKQRHNFGQYSSLTQAAPSTPTALIPPDLN